MSFTIKLLSNKRYRIQNRCDNLIIMAEHNATKITVGFPEEYEHYSKRVDFLTAHKEGWTEALYVPEFMEYPTAFDKLVFSFVLPNDVTYAGELQMQFVAYKPDNSLECIPFDIVPLQIEDGVTKYKKSGAKNPDLIVLSYNKSVEALFIAQQAKNSANHSDQQSREALTVAANADETARLAIATAQNAEAASSHAERKSAQAESIATEANYKSDNAIATAREAFEGAAEANSTANTALLTAQVAESNSDQAVATAQTALSASAEAVTRSNTAAKSADAALATATNAVNVSNTASTTAAQADANASQALTTANGATTAATEAQGNSEQALKISGEAKTLAKSVVDRADDGEFTGPRGPKGDKGEAGSIGPPGINGTTNNFFGLYVNDDGYLVVSIADEQEVFLRLDEETGNLYFIGG